MMTIRVLDHGAGNLHSIVKALAADGDRVDVVDDALAATRGDLLVLPGVGAFGAAAARLAPARVTLRAAVADGRALLGVCLGMQLLFDSSEEGPGSGLGLVAGRVRRLAGRRVPHMGWNTLEPVVPGDPGIPATAYFAHGYACEPADPAVVSAWCTHETQRFAAAVRRGRVAGVQFHPEKSGDAGVASLLALARALAGADVEAR